MSFRTVPTYEWEVIQRVDGDAKKVRQRAVLLIENLVMQYGAAVPGAYHGVKFSSLDDKRVLGTISSEIGDGRFTLTFAFAEKELVGNLQIERAVTSTNSEFGWEPIWGIVIPTQGPIYAGRNPGRFIIPTATGDYSGARAQAVFELGQIILYAMVRGPLTE